MRVILSFVGLGIFDWLIDVCVCVCVCDTNSAFENDEKSELMNRRDKEGKQKKAKKRSQEDLTKETVKCEVKEK